MGLSWGQPRVANLMRREGTPADSLASTVVSRNGRGGFAGCLQWATYFGFRSVSEPLGQLLYVQLPALVAGSVRDRHVDEARIRGRVLAMCAALSPVESGIRRLLRSGPHPI